MIEIHPMHADDLPLGMQLSQQEGWNQTVTDWKRFLALQPSGCFVAKLDDRSVGSVATCIFERIGWIGTLLVSKDSRRRGVGLALMKKAIDYLENQGVETIRLDATEMGQPLYESLGFVTEYRSTRFAGIPDCLDVEQPPDPLLREQWERVVVFDRMIIGYNRRPLLIQLFQEPTNHAFIDQRNDSVGGYVCARPGRIATQIGPCIAITPNVGRMLMEHAAHQFRGQSVFVDVPNSNRPSVETTSSLGLEPAREFVRMCRGALVREQLDRLWASSGPETG